MDVESVLIIHVIVSPDLIILMSDNEIMIINIDFIMYCEIITPCTHYLYLHTHPISLDVITQL